LAAAELRRLIRLVDPDVLALVAVDALINVIVAGWDWEEESAAMKVALSVGQTLREEIEMWPACGTPTRSIIGGGKGLYGRRRTISATRQ
jgi:hypothetical protein